MYLPEHFKEVDPAEIAAIIADAPLGCLVAQTSEGLIANHLPIFVDKQGALVGHVALSNDMHRLIEDSQEVLVVFRGVDGYISPNTYPSKQEHHRHVPTWNYQVVHVYGKITFQHDVRDKRAAVGSLTREQERRVNDNTAWRMADAPVDYMEGMLREIVAFRITITQTITKSKLSQNRDQQDFDGAVAGLRSNGRILLADRMEATRQR